MSALQCTLLMGFEHRWHCLAQIKHKGQEWWLVHYIQLCRLNRGCRCAWSTLPLVGVSCIFQIKESKLTVKALMEKSRPKAPNIINTPQDKHFWELFSSVHPQLKMRLISDNKFPPSLFWATQCQSSSAGIYFGKSFLGNRKTRSVSGWLFYGKGSCLFHN